MIDLLAIEKKLDLSLKNNEFGTDKQFPKKYLEYVYNPVFFSANTPGVLVEIGVRSGASLALWANAFPETKIIGIDNLEINPSLKLEYLNYPNIKRVVMDAYTLETIIQLPNQIDILIDDGPHSLESHFFAVKNYLPSISPNGYFFIEDIIGGNFHINSIINSIPLSFQGCVRVFDLRKISNQHDAIIVLIHNCTKCSIPSKNYNTKSNRLKIKIKIVIYSVFAMFGIKRYKL